MPDVTLADAIREAYTVAPVDAIIYHTLTFNHPDFTVPARVVYGYEDITAAGEDFIAMPFTFQLPEVSGDGPPQLKITIDNVSRVLLESIEKAAESSKQIEVVYRAFLNTDLTQPQNNPPLRLTLSSITCNVQTITAVATLANFVNKKWPRVVYTDNLFPGLAT